MEIKILYEDKSIIVAVKPPNIPSQPDKTGDMDIFSFLSEKYGISNGGIVHRLDRGVGGIMVFARDKASLSSLSAQFADKTTKKKYAAVLMGEVPQKSGILKDYMIKKSGSNFSVIAKKGDRDAKEAVLSYEVLQSVQNEKYGTLTLADINLETGRHHQIRLQFSNIGCPIWGDTKYNSNFRKIPGGFNIALFSYFLSFKHPLTKEGLSFKEAPVDFPFSEFENFFLY
ncbi:MAG: RluA family pseudouridine synthase [Lachnospiraceae bacterium]|nr:RluA family pseudouridine synthase [Lachnospiraceae bacterium]